MLQVEQWARAMFTDQVFHAGSPPAASSGPGMPAPTGILLAAVDRLRSLAPPLAVWGPPAPPQPASTAGTPSARP